MQDAIIAAKRIVPSAENLRLEADEETRTAFIFVEPSRHPVVSIRFRQEYEDESEIAPYTLGFPA